MILISNFPDVAILLAIQLFDAELSFLAILSAIEVD
jgi:hypothetical protein